MADAKPSDERRGDAPKPTPPGAAAWRSRCVGVFTLGSIESLERDASGNAAEAVGVAAAGVGASKRGRVDALKRSSTVALKAGVGVGDGAGIGAVGVAAAGVGASK
jgi:hypothetical protein